MIVFRSLEGAALSAVLLAGVSAGFSAGCSARDDYQGATNTDPQVQSDDSCTQLTACCAGLPEDQQSMCNAGANSGDGNQCAISLGQFRANGACQ